MRRYVAMLLLVSVLTGCGGDPPPAAPPAPASPTSTTPTPVAAPTMPEEATKNTRAGAVAFVKYYVQLINHAQATGDTHGVELVSADACRSCRAFIKNVHALYRDGGTIRGGAWLIRDSAVTHIGARDWQVTVACAFSPQTIQYGDGHSRRAPAGKGVLFFALHHDSTWAVATWSRS